MKKEVILGIILSLSFLLTMVPTSASPQNYWSISIVEGHWELLESYHWKAAPDYVETATCRATNDWFSHTEPPLWMWWNAIVLHQTIAHNDYFSIDSSTSVYIANMSNNYESGWVFVYTFDQQSYPNRRERLRVYSLSNGSYDPNNPDYDHYLAQTREADDLYYPYHNFDTRIIETCTNSYYKKYTVWEQRYDGSSSPLQSRWLGFGGVDLGKCYLYLKTTKTGYGFVEVWRTDNIRKQGDNNGDGLVNIADASFIGAHWQEHCPFPQPYPGPEWENWAASATDFNCDGIINISDQAVISRWWQK